MMGQQLRTTAAAGQRRGLWCGARRRPGLRATRSRRLADGEGQGGLFLTVAPGLAWPGGTCLVVHCGCCDRQRIERMSEVGLGPGCRQWGERAPSKAAACDGSQSCLILTKVAWGVALCRRYEARCLLPRPALQREGLRLGPGALLYNSRRHVLCAGSAPIAVLLGPGDVRVGLYVTQRLSTTALRAPHRHPESRHAPGCE
jgi:hypothetical protein